MFNKLRISSAETFVLHSFLSLFVGALASGLASVVTIIAQSGFNIPVIASVGGGMFSGYFLHGFIALRSSPQFGQAEKDGLAQVQDQVQSLTGSHADILSYIEELRQVVLQQKAASTSVVAPVTTANLFNPGAAATATFVNPSLQGVPQLAFPAAGSGRISYGDTGLVPAMPPRG